MGDNLKIRMFRENLLKVIDMSDLPIEVKRMTLEMILQEATKVADKRVQEELKEYKAKEKE